MFDDNVEIIYKGIRLNNQTNEVKVLIESTDKEYVEMEVYLDKQDEPSPDKEYVYTWLTVRYYK
jgi:hypothetical protein